MNNNSIFTVTGLLNQDGNGNPVGHHITSAMLVNDNNYSGKYVQNNNDPNNSGSIDISDQYSYTIVDQDGVDVRINYEYNLEVLKNPTNASSLMLIPLHLEFTASEMISIKENLITFEELGFKLEQASPTSFFVWEYPMWLHVDDCEDFLRNILYNAYRDKQFTIEKYRDRLAAEIACKASIKANHAIKKEEIDTLLENLR